MIDWRIQADSFGTCNCDHCCPCQFEGDPTHYSCEGVEGFRVTSGHFGDVDLSGVVATVIYSWPGPVYKGGGTMQTIVGEGASAEQIDAIDRLAKGEETVEASNIWWVYHAMSDHILETLVKPITFEVDIESRIGLIEIPGLLKATGEPIRNPHDGGEHRVQIRVPNGIEFEIADVGNSHTVATGDIKLDMANTFGQFNTIDFTGEGPAHNR
jgi:hypothetical protein